MYPAHRHEPCPSLTRMRSSRPRRRPVGSLCPGSALMESRFPEAGDKAAAAEGTAAHWCMQQLFDGWAPDVAVADGQDRDGHPLRAKWSRARNCWSMTCARPSGDHRPTVVEQRVANSARPPVGQLGHARRARVGPDPFTGTTTLYLWDFKYGHGIVEAFENWQLIDYVAGIVDEMRHVPEDRITVVMRVVQPRAYHRDGPVREWRVRATNCATTCFACPWRPTKPHRPQPECKPQPAACENCTARHACEALQRAAYRGMDLARQAQASELTPAALGLEMRYLTDASKLMGARLTGLMAQAEALRCVATPCRTGARKPQRRAKNGRCPQAR
jgi:hypothetical protein